MIYRYAIPFPVAPGKTDADAGSLAAYLKANMDQYRESRKRLGTTMERVYLQATPMGSVVISYAEAEQPFGAWVQAIVTSDLEIDKRFVAMVADIHGSTSGSHRPARHPRQSGSGSIPGSPREGRGSRSWHPSCPGRMTRAGHSPTRRSSPVGRSQRVEEGARAERGGRDLERHADGFVHLWLPRGDRSGRWQPALRGFHSAIRRLVQGPAEGHLPAPDRLQPATAANQGALRLRGVTRSTRHLGKGARRPRADCAAPIPWPARWRVVRASSESRASPWRIDCCG